MFTFNFTIQKNSAIFLKQKNGFSREEWLRNDGSLPLLDEVRTCLLQAA
jgi:hypothetical protein